MMDAETRELVAAHVSKLEWLALSCKDDDRRLDAIRSLAVMALLADNEPPTPDTPETNVIHIMDFINARAA